jgi:hypothetical protein
MNDFQKFSLTAVTAFLLGVLTTWASVNIGTNAALLGENDAFNQSRIALEAVTSRLDALPKSK